MTDRTGLLIQAFVESGERNAWIIHHGHFSLYLRRSQRPVEGRMLNFLDVANVSVDESVRGRGIFRQVFAAVLATGLNVFVESIMSPAVEHVCISEGFSVYRDYGPVKDMYKMQEKNV